MTKLKVTRLSSLPNKFGSYVYRVEDTTPLKDIPDPVLWGDEGNILFSPIRIESGNVDFYVKEVNGMNYINLRAPEGDIDKLAKVANNSSLYSKLTGIQATSLSDSVQTGIALSALFGQNGQKVQQQSEAVGTIVEEEGS